MDVSGGLTLVETLLKTLGSPIWTEIESILGVKSELVKLKKTITTIQAVLLDADQQQLHQQQRRSHVERDRLERLKDALYRADDLFDEIATLAHRKKLLSNNKASRELRVFFSSSNQLYCAHIWSKEMKKIREMLDDIVKDHRFEFGQRHPVALEPWRKMKITHNPRETHSFCDEGGIIGRENDKKKVIDMLLGSTSVDKDVSVVSIVGIGGLGKTSLAQLVYNDAVIKTEFPLRMWVCVSDDFNLGALLQQIIAAAKNQNLRNDGQETMDQLQSSLREVLNGKKYLLVLDDIWNEDPLIWHELSVLLEKGGRGSKIIVTTRSNVVVDVVGSREIHELGGLSEDDSWKLFERIAFEGENNQKEDDLVTIGKEILCKCRNVPLAIRVVGSLLRGQDTRTWEYIKNTDLVNIKQDDNGIIPVLKISYYHLPFHLKSCFSYCAVFPKDYKIVKDDLIHLWMAQGFVMPLVGQSLEDAGDKYFNHLLQRCFFQDVEKDSSGKIISCKMHDLIHDVAKEVAGTEILSSFNNSNNDFNERTRHIFIDYNTTGGSDNIVSSFKKMKRMRSLLSNDSPYMWDSPSRSRIKLLLSEVRYLRQLRVLDLHFMGLVEVPSMIGELMHLRYLDLSYNYEFTMLPGSITKLYNLQTLKLRNCNRLQTLPRDLSKLVNLRCLDIFGCDSLRYMPPRMNKMTSLHKLTGFVISGTRKTSQWRSHCVGELGDLVNITNHADILTLIVYEDARYDTIQAKKLRNLMHEQHLREIKITWQAENDESVGNTNVGVLLEGLEFCQNLSQIILEGLKCSVPWLDHLPRLNHLRHLKVLKLNGLRNLKCVESSDISEDGASAALSRTEDLVFFSSLEELNLKHLPKFKGWWETTDKSDSGENVDKQEAHNQLTTAGMHFNSYSFPRLTSLTISDCPELKTIPYCPNLEKLKLDLFNRALKPFINLSNDERLSWSCNDVEQGGLREVKIDDAEYLNYVPLESFHRLSHLAICNDTKTKSLPSGMVFPSGCLCCLRFLAIRSCFELKRLSWEGFWEHCTALETLRLITLTELMLEDEDEEEVKSSSKDGDEGEIRKEVAPWRFLSHSLRNLSLINLLKLKKLPNGMRHLTSLQSLEINYCDTLKSMSEEMRHLTSLQQLTLRYNSMELQERCKKPNGADWPNIQHIPKIEITVYDDTMEQYSTVTYEN